MNMKNEIPEGWYKLNPEEKVCSGDKFQRYSTSDWEYSCNNFGDRCQSVGFTYIRKIDSEYSTYNPTPFKIGDKVVINGYNGTIHSDRLYLSAGYGYLITFDRLFNINELRYSSNIIPFRDCFIKRQEPAIMVGGNEVKFENGNIKVGCTVVPNELVKQIAAKLK